MSGCAGKHKEGPLDPDEVFRCRTDEVLLLWCVVLMGLNFRAHSRLFDRGM